MFLLVFMVVGLAGIGAGSFSLVRNVRESRRRVEQRKVVAVLVTSAIGLMLAAGSFLVAYPYGKNMRIVGFPFPAAAWERHGDHWMDFVGPLMLPFMCANAWFAFVLPHLVIRVLRRRTG